MRDVVDPAAMPTSGCHGTYCSLQMNVDVEATAPALGAFPEITSGG